MEYVGLIVGLQDSVPSVGPNVGAEDLLNIGARVGNAEVGFVVGNQEGGSVGFDVGNGVVGESVTLVGLAVGLHVNESPVGPTVGTEVGRIVGGDCVGSVGRIGDSVG